MGPTAAVGVPEEGETSTFPFLRLLTAFLPRLVNSESLTFHWWIYSNREVLEQNQHKRSLKIHPVCVCGGRICSLTNPVFNVHR